jgi:hypothetical protein
MSDKPIHEYFGRQADLLLNSATTIIEDWSSHMTGETV